MNVFSKNGLKIEYTVRMGRFSVSKDNEWISFSPTVLTVVVAIARTQTRSERVIVNEQECHIEVIKVLGNFMVSVKSKDTTSSLTIECDVVNSLASSFNNIMEAVKNQNEVRKPIEKPNQRNNKFGEFIMK